MLQQIDNEEERKHRRLDGVLCVLSVETDWEGLVRVGFWDYSCTRKKRTLLQL